jgi:hypothetical protein
MCYVIVSERCTGNNYRNSPAADTLRPDTFENACRECEECRQYIPTEKQMVKICVGISLVYALRMMPI